MWEYIVKLILRNRPVNLIIIALITAFMGYKAQDVKLSYEFLRHTKFTDNIPQSRQPTGDKGNREALVMTMRHIN